MYNNCIIAGTIKITINENTMLFLIFNFSIFLVNITPLRIVINVPK
mgnify:CR=1 FL=1